MGLSDLFWVFIVLSMVQPALSRRLLEGQRAAALRALEQKRSSRVITLIHRQESMGFLGFPLFRYIDLNDSEEVLRAIRLTDDEVPIDLILHTPGGLVLPTSQMARALELHKAKVTVFVPHYAMSGGTLLALAADEIVMDPAAVLGPVDPQLGDKPAASIVRAVTQKGVEHVDDATLIEADVARMALDQMAGTVRELLRDRYDDEVRKRLIDVLTQGRMTHDNPIHADEAQALGLHVSTDIPPEVHTIMSLHPQAVQGKPSVGYVPEPYGRSRPSR